MTTPEAQCLMNNCRKRAPADEAFCAEHREPMRPLAPHERPTIWVQFSDNGRHIRKWAFERFDGGTRYLPAYEPYWSNPDGPTAA